jgi:hypothetical protein
MNVHEAITRHSQNQHRHLEIFAQLEARREQAIEATIEKCRSGTPYDVNEINEVTRQINEHAKHGISPSRKYVSTAMVEQYVAKNRGNE